MPAPELIDTHCRAGTQLRASTAEAHPKESGGSVSRRLEVTGSSHTLGAVARAPLRERVPPHMPAWRGLGRAHSPTPLARRIGLRVPRWRINRPVAGFRIRPTQSTPCRAFLVALFPTCCRTLRGEYWCWRGRSLLRLAVGESNSLNNLPFDAFYMPVRARQSRTVCAGPCEPCVSAFHAARQHYQFAPWPDSSVSFTDSRSPLA